jgi:hypothetical protein
MHAMAMLHAARGHFVAVGSEVTLKEKNEENAQGRGDAEACHMLAGFRKEVKQGRAQQRAASSRGPV